MKTSLQGHIFGNANSAATFPAVGRSMIRLLPDPADHYHPSSSDHSSQALQQCRKGSVLNRVNKLGRKADSFAHGLREHVRLGAKITETVKGKLSLGAKIIQVGGLRKVYKKLFKVKEGEKLMKACQCYLSTTAGPIAGLLFISTHNLAFCSDRSIKISSPINGEQVRVHYKVVIPLDKIKRVNQNENVMKPSEKYVEVITVDDFDFWFMGFFNFKKAFRFLQQAISQA